MILHTVMPLELVFADVGPTDPPVEIEIDGHRLLVQRSGQAWSVVRLLSSDPADYLDPRWEPGTVLRASLS